MSNNFKIEVDNTWTHIIPIGDYDKAILKRVEQEMSYTRQQYLRFKKKFVDIDITLYERQELKYPTGLYYLLDNILTDCGCSFEVVDVRGKPKDNTPLQFHSKTLRDYQEEVVEKSINNERGVIKIATGGGKTVIAASIVARLNLKTLFIVYSIDLLEQTADEFEKMFQIKVGKIGGGHLDIKQINICTVQTLHAAFDLKYSVDDVELHVKEKVSKKVLERKEDIRKAVQQAEVVIYDECFYKLTKVHVDLDKQMFIKDICENDLATHVLSYNFEKKVFEKKKILKKIVKPLLDKWYHVKFSFKTKIKILVCTGNHKIWTKNRGYVQAKDLIAGDVLKINTKDSHMVYFCKTCKKFEKKSHLSGFTHLNTKGIKFSEETKKRRDSKPEYVLYKQKLSKRMKDNNPMKNLETRKQVGKTIRENFNNKTEEEKAKIRENFINAPKRCKGKPITPTSLEQKLIDMNLPELAYTGNGKFWMNIGVKEENKPWSKNPDFKVRGQRKVIEVGNVTHWHTYEEIERVIKGFESKNFKCLYLTNYDIEDNWELTKNKILTFIYNHDEAIVVSSTYCYSAPNKTVKNGFSYNLEVEDNHNYFANGILVSNCHKASASTYIQLSQLYEKAYYKYFFSATPYRDSSIDKVLDAYSGQMICNISASYLIDKGFLVPPKIYMLDPNEHTEYKFIRKSFPKIYDQWIVNNELRNRMVVDSTQRLLDLGKSVLITVTRIPHGDIISEMLDKAGVKSIAFIQGEVDGEMRKKLLNQVRNKELQVIVGTSVCDEGIDLPALGSAIMAGGGKSLIKSLQRVGRTLRPYPSAENNEKKEAIIVDFYDRVRYLTGHSNKRIKIYQSEPRFEVFKHF